MLGIKIAAMPEKYLFYFGLTGLVGLIIMGAGLKLSDRPKRIIETLGAVVFHVGAFGILYFKVSITLFISLVSLVLSLFVLIDPLKLSLQIGPKVCRRTGFTLLAIAAAFFIMYFTNFPVWLWLIPMVIYVSPLVIPQLKKQEAMLTVMASVCVFVYAALIAYALYSRFYPDHSNLELTAWFTQDPGEGIMSTIDSDQKKLLEKLEEETGTIEKTAETQALPLPRHSLPAAPFQPLQEDGRDDVFLNSHREEFRLFSQDGPFLKSLREADNRFLKLRDEYRKLKQRVSELENENTELKRRLSGE